MKLKNKSAWEKWVKENADDNYGKACVDVARRVMEILDENKDFDPHDIICQANKDIDCGGITGFMAGCVAQMVSGCHERGDEFRRKWNTDMQIGNKGEKANENGGVLNPAILNVKLNE